MASSRRLAPPNGSKSELALKSSKVRLLSFGSTCEFHSPDAAIRKQNVDTGKRWIELAHDTGAWGVKVRPNGLPKDVPKDTTVGRIADCLRELGDYGAGRGVEIWMEVHGARTQEPPVSAAIMKATRHEAVGLCWNSNPTDIVNGSVKPSFDLLRPWIKNVHINELANDKYPWRELFTLLQRSKYERYTLCEAPRAKSRSDFCAGIGRSGRSCPAHERAAALALVSCFPLLAAVPSPETHFGHAMGADRKLLDWSKVVSYFQLLSKNL